MKTKRNFVSAVLFLTAATGGYAATHYVSLESTNPTPPYTTWATAATNIQDAVDVAGTNDVVVVTNGVYPGFVNVTNPLTLLSVNGPLVTIIIGPGRCVWNLADNATLSGFTLTNGTAFSAGGGVFCASTNSIITNCVIVGNEAYPRGGYGGRGGGVYRGTLYHCTLSGNSAEGGDWPRNGSRGGGAEGSILYDCILSGNEASSGGGASRCTLYNCTLAGNSAYWGGSGGGAVECTLYNCTLTGNSADYGGGASGCTLYNCTVVDNTACYSGGGVAESALTNCIIAYNVAWVDNNYTPDPWSTLNYCCTWPLPSNGVGNISVPPQFTDYAHANLQLQSNSPCINAGNNAYAPGPADLDGNPRIVSGTVDIGAYEYQGPGSIISYAWLQQFGLPTDGSTDYTDSDHDGLKNWQEWRCGTCPTNCLSALRLSSALPTGTHVTISWESVARINYFLERSPNLAAAFCFTCVATNLPGQAGTTSYTDTYTVGSGPYFYRVGVGN